MKVLDLFSGIGGFSLGLERAGMETVAFCEISPVCRHLLAHHWPDAPSQRRREARQRRSDQPSKRSGWDGRSIASQWLVEPDVGRVAHGVPARSHRLHGLGNAVVPQIPEIIGCAIKAAANPVREEIAA